jgi:hypothetical protein
MPATTDLKAEALFLEGYRGSVSDMVDQWLAAELGHDGQIMDQWSALFDRDSVPLGQHNERLFQWYGLADANGATLADRSHSYWLARRNTALLEYIRGIL